MIESVLFQRAPYKKHRSGLLTIALIIVHRATMCLQVAISHSQFIEMSSDYLFQSAVQKVDMVETQNRIKCYYLCQFIFAHLQNDF